MPDATPITDDDATFRVTSPSVGCDGGGGALGHPLVYLAIGHEGWVACPYCSRQYILTKGAPTAPGASTAHGH